MLLLATQVKPTDFVSVRNVPAKFPIAKKRRAKQGNLVEDTHYMYLSIILVRTELSVYKNKQKSSAKALTVLK